MSKVNTKKYAVAFYEATKDLSQAELKTATGNFVKLLAKKGLLSKADKIIDEFINYYDKKQGITPVSAKSAQALTETERKEIIAQLKKVTGKEIELSSHINKDFIGGLVLQIGDTLIDGSLQTQLLKLKQRLSS